MKLHILNRLLAFQLALVIFLTFAGCKKSGVSSVDGTSVAADTSAADNFQVPKNLSPLQTRQTVIPVPTRLQNI